MGNSTPPGNEIRQAGFDSLNGLAEPFPKNTTKEKQAHKKHLR